VLSPLLLEAPHDRSRGRTIGQASPTQTTATDLAESGAKPRAKREMRGAESVTGGEDQGPRREIEQDLSVPEEYLIVQQQEKEERERIKTRVQGHLCAEGCGHICWVANEFPTPTGFAP
jgi:hypothetical protein